MYSDITSWQKERCKNFFREDKVIFYIYFCKECNLEKEVEHSIIQDPEIKCPKCQAVMKKKITGGAGVHYKGVGWPRKYTGTHAPIRKIKEEKIIGPPIR